MSLYVFGTGGHAKVVAETFASQGVAIDGFIDPNSQSRRFYEQPVFADPREIPGGHSFFVAVGNNELRKKLFEEGVSLGWQAVSAIHASAVISTTAQIGSGVLLGAGSIVNANSLIGTNVIINTGAIVEHDCLIGDHSHLAPRVVLGGHCVVEEGSLIGVGSVMRPQSKVGGWSTVGAGSVVINDVESGVVAFGVPCRIV